MENPVRAPGHVRQVALFNKYASDRSPTLPRAAGRSIMEGYETKMANPCVGFSTHFFEFQGDLPSPVVTQEIQIVVDGQLILGCCFRPSPVVPIKIAGHGWHADSGVADSSGHPSMRLDNPDVEGPVAILEVDDKGAHVKFDRSGRARLELPLPERRRNRFVFVRRHQRRQAGRRAVAPDGTAKIDRYGANGELLP